ncbi:MAG: hypothetical protein P9L93_04165 [Candidatus Gorgyraea atricola]|nr:hypothetical protein [Candidatus Gorgyraea atricola]
MLTALSVLEYDSRINELNIKSSFKWYSPIVAYTSDVIEDLYEAGRLNNPEELVLSYKILSRQQELFSDYEKKFSDWGKRNKEDYAKLLIDIKTNMQRYIKDGYFHVEDFSDKENAKINALALALISKEDMEEFGLVLDGSRLDLASLYFLDWLDRNRAESTDTCDWVLRKVNKKTGLPENNSLDGYASLEQIAYHAFGFMENTDLKSLKRMFDALQEWGFIRDSKGEITVNGLYDSYSVATGFPRHGAGILTRSQALLGIALLSYDSLEEYPDLLHEIVKGVTGAISMEKGKVGAKRDQTKESGLNLVDNIVTYRFLVDLRDFYKRTGHDYLADPISDAINPIRTYLERQSYGGEFRYDSKDDDSLISGLGINGFVMEMLGRDGLKDIGFSKDKIKSIEKTIKVADGVTDKDLLRQFMLRRWAMENEKTEELEEKLKERPWAKWRDYIHWTVIILCAFVPVALHWLRPFKHLGTMFNWLKDKLKGLFKSKKKTDEKEAELEEEDEPKAKDFQLKRMSEKASGSIAVEEFKQWKTSLEENLEEKEEIAREDIMSKIDELMVSHGLTRSPPEIVGFYRACLSECPGQLVDFSDELNSKTGDEEKFGVIEALKELETDLKEPAFVLTKAHIKKLGEKFKLDEDAVDKELIKDNYAFEFILKPIAVEAVYRGTIEKVFEDTGYKDKDEPMDKKDMEFVVRPTLQKIRERLFTDYILEDQKADDFKDLEKNEKDGLCMVTAGTEEVVDGKYHTVPLEDYIIHKIVARNIGPLATRTIEGWLAKDMKEMLTKKAKGPEVVRQWLEKNIYMFTELMQSGIIKYRWSNNPHGPGGGSWFCFDEEEVDDFFRYNLFGDVRTKDGIGFNDKEVTTKQLRKLGIKEKLDELRKLSEEAKGREGESYFLNLFNQKLKRFGLLDAWQGKGKDKLTVFDYMTIITAGYDAMAVAGGQDKEKEIFGWANPRKSEAGYLLITKGYGEKGHFLDEFIIKKFDFEGTIEKAIKEEYKEDPFKGEVIAKNLHGVRGMLKILWLPVRDLLPGIIGVALLSLLVVNFGTVPELVKFILGIGSIVSLIWQSKYKKYFFTKGLRSKPKQERFWMWMSGIWLVSAASMFKLGVVATVATLFSNGTVMGPVIGSVLALNLILAQILIFPAIVQIFGQTIPNWWHDRQDNLSVIKSDEQLYKEKATWFGFSRSMTEELWKKCEKLWKEHKDDTPEELKKKKQELKEKKLSWNLMIAGMSPLTDMTDSKRYEIYEEEMMSLMLLTEGGFDYFKGKDSDYKIERLIEISASEEKAEEAITIEYLGKKQWRNALKKLVTRDSKTVIKNWANNLLMHNPSEKLDFPIMPSLTVYIPTGGEPVEYTYTKKSGDEKIGKDQAIAEVPKQSFDTLLHFIKKGFKDRTDGKEEAAAAWEIMIESLTARFPKDSHKQEYYFITDVLAKIQEGISLPQWREVEGEDRGYITTRRGRYGISHDSWREIEFTLKDFIHYVSPYSAYSAMTGMNIKKAAEEDARRYYKKRGGESDNAYNQRIKALVDEKVQIVYKYDGYVYNFATEKYRYVDALQAIGIELSPEEREEIMLKKPVEKSRDDSFVKFVENVNSGQGSILEKDLSKKIEEKLGKFNADEAKVLRGKLYFIRPIEQPKVNDTSVGKTMADGGKLIVEEEQQKEWKETYDKNITSLLTGEAASVTKVIEDYNIDFFWEGTHSQDELVDVGKYYTTSVNEYRFKGDLKFIYDNDMRVRMEDARSLLRVISKFRDEASLGILGFPQYSLTGKASDSEDNITFAEEAWTGEVQRWGARQGLFRQCGKCIERQEYLDNYESLQSGYVAEDSAGGYALARFGITTDYTSEFWLGTQFGQTFRQWSGTTGYKFCMDSAELAQRKSMRYFWMSDKVHWSDKVTAMFQTSFYWLKPVKLAYNLSFVFLYWLMGINPFVVMPTILLIGSFLFLGYMWSQSSLSVGMRSKIKQLGVKKGIEYVLGSTKQLKAALATGIATIAFYSSGIQLPVIMGSSLSSLIPFIGIAFTIVFALGGFKNFFKKSLFFISLIPVYFQAMMREGLSRHVFFALTSETGDDRITKEPEESIFERHKFGMKAGLFFFIAFMLVSFHPWKLLATLPALLFLLAQFFGPYYYNSVSLSRNRKWYAIKWGFISMWWLVVGTHRTKARIVERIEKSREMGDTSVLERHELLSELWQSISEEERRSYLKKAREKGSKNIYYRARNMCFDHYKKVSHKGWSRFTKAFIVMVLVMTYYFSAPLLAVTLVKVFLATAAVSKIIEIFMAKNPDPNTYLFHGWSADRRKQTSEIRDLRYLTFFEEIDILSKRTSIHRKFNELNRDFLIPAKTLEKIDELEKDLKEAERTDGTKALTEKYNNIYIDKAKRELETVDMAYVPRLLGTIAKVKAQMVELTEKELNAEELEKAFHKSINSLYFSHSYGQRVLPAIMWSLPDVESAVEFCDKLRKLLNRAMDIGTLSEFMGTTLDGVESNINNKNKSIDFKDISEFRNYLAKLKEHVKHSSEVERKEDKLYERQDNVNRARYWARFMKVITPFIIAGFALSPVTTGLFVGGALISYILARKAKAILISELWKWNKTAWIAFTVLSVFSPASGLLVICALVLASLLIGIFKIADILIGKDARLNFKKLLILSKLSLVRSDLNTYRARLSKDKKAAVKKAQEHEESLEAAEKDRDKKESEFKQQKEKLDIQERNVKNLEEKLAMDSTDQLLYARLELEKSNLELGRISLEAAKEAFEGQKALVKVIKEPAAMQSQEIVSDIKRRRTKLDSASERIMESQDTVEGQLDGSYTFSETRHRGDLMYRGRHATIKQAEELFKQSTRFFLKIVIWLHRPASAFKMVFYDAKIALYESSKRFPFVPYIATGLVFFVTLVSSVYKTLRRTKNFVRSFAIKGRLERSRQAIEQRLQKVFSFLAEQDYDLSSEELIYSKEKKLLDAQGKTQKRKEAVAAQRKKMGLPAGILVIFGNEDIGSIREAARLIKNDIARSALVTGGKGNAWKPLLRNARNAGYLPSLDPKAGETEDKTKAGKTEAEVIAWILKQEGVPEEKIEILKSTSEEKFIDTKKTADFLKKYLEERAMQQQARIEAMKEEIKKAREIYNIKNEKLQSAGHKLKLQNERTMSAKKEHGLVMLKVNKIEGEIEQLKVQNADSQVLEQKHKELGKAKSYLGDIEKQEKLEKGKKVECQNKFDQLENEANLALQEVNNKVKKVDALKSKILQRADELKKLEEGKDKKDEAAKLRLEIEKEKIYDSIIVIQESLRTKRTKLTIKESFDDEITKDRIKFISYAPYIPDFSKMSNEGISDSIVISKEEFENFDKYGPDGKRHMKQCKIPEDVRKAREDLDRMQYIQILKEASKDISKKDLPREKDKEKITKSDIDKMVSKFEEDLLKGKVVLMGDKDGDPAAQVKIILDYKGEIKEKIFQIHKVLLDRLIDARTRQSESYETYKEILKALLIKECGHYTTSSDYDLIRIAHLKRQFMENPNDKDAAKNFTSIQLSYEFEKYSWIIDYLKKKDITAEGLEELAGIENKRYEKDKKKLLADMMPELKSKRQETEIENKVKELLSPKVYEFLPDLMCGLATFMKRYEEHKYLAVAEDLAQGRGHGKDAIALALKDDVFKNSLMGESKIVSFKDGQDPDDIKAYLRDHYSSVHVPQREKTFGEALLPDEQGRIRKAVDWFRNKSMSKSKKELIFGPVNSAKPPPATEVIEPEIEDKGEPEPGKIEDKGEPEPGTPLKQKFKWIKKLQQFVKLNNLNCLGLLFILPIKKALSFAPTTSDPSLLWPVVIVGGIGLLLGIIFSLNSSAKKQLIKKHNTALVNCYCDLPNYASLFQINLSGKKIFRSFDAKNARNWPKQINVAHVKGWGIPGKLYLISPLKKTEDESMETCLNAVKRMFEAVKSKEQILDAILNGDEEITIIIIAPDGTQKKIKIDNISKLNKGNTSKFRTKLLSKAKVVTAATLALLLAPTLLNAATKISIIQSSLLLPLGIIAGLGLIISIIFLRPSYKPTKEQIDTYNRKILRKYISKQLKEHPHISTPFSVNLKKGKPPVVDCPTGESGMKIIDQCIVGMYIEGNKGNKINLMLPLKETEQELLTIAQKAARRILEAKKFWSIEFRPNDQVIVIMITKDGELKTFKKKLSELAEDTEKQHLAPYELAQWADRFFIAALVGFVGLALGHAEIHYLFEIIIGGLSIASLIKSFSLLIKAISFKYTLEHSSNNGVFWGITKSVRGCSTDRLLYYLCKIEWLVKMSNSLLKKKDIEDVDIARDLLPEIKNQISNEEAVFEEIISDRDAKQIAYCHESDGKIHYMARKVHGTLIPVIAQYPKRLQYEVYYKELKQKLTGSEFKFHLMAILFARFKFKNRDSSSKKVPETIFVPYFKQHDVKFEEKALEALGAQVAKEMRYAILIVRQLNIILPKKEEQKAAFTEKDAKELIQRIKAEFIEQMLKELKNGPTKKTSLFALNKEITSIEEVCKKLNISDSWSDYFHEYALKVIDYFENNTAVDFSYSKDYISPLYEAILLNRNSGLIMAARLIKKLIEKKGRDSHFSDDVLIEQCIRLAIFEEIEKAITESEVEEQKLIIKGISSVMGDRELPMTILLTIAKELTSLVKDNNAHKKDKILSFFFRDTLRHERKVLRTNTLITLATIVFFPLFFVGLLASGVSLLFVNREWKSKDIDEKIVSLLAYLIEEQNSNVQSGKIIGGIDEKEIKRGADLKDIIKSKDRKIVRKIVLLGRFLTQPVWSEPSKRALVINRWAPWLFISEGFAQYCALSASYYNYFYNTTEEKERINKYLIAVEAAHFAFSRTKKLRSIPFTFIYITHKSLIALAKTLKDGFKKRANNMFHLTISAPVSYSVLALSPMFLEMDPVLALVLRIVGFIGLVAPFLMTIIKPNELMYDVNHDVVVDNADGLDERGIDRLLGKLRPEAGKEVKFSLSRKRKFRPDIIIDRFEKTCEGDSDKGYKVTYTLKVRNQYEEKKEMVAGILDIFNSNGKSNISCKFENDKEIGIGDIAVLVVEGHRSRDEIIECAEQIASVLRQIEHGRVSTVGKDIKVRLHLKHYNNAMCMEYARRLSLIIAVGSFELSQEELKQVRRIMKATGLYRARYASGRHARPEIDPVDFLEWLCSTDGFGSRYYFSSHYDKDIHKVIKDLIKKEPFVYHLLLNDYFSPNTVSFTARYKAQYEYIKEILLPLMRAKRKRESDKPLRIKIADLGCSDGRVLARVGATIHEDMDDNYYVLGSVFPPFLHLGMNVGLEMIGADISSSSISSGKNQLTDWEVVLNEMYTDRSYEMTPRKDLQGYEYNHTIDGHNKEDMKEVDYINSNLSGNDLTSIRHAISLVQGSVIDKKILRRVIDSDIILINSMMYLLTPEAREKLWKFIRDNVSPDTHILCAIADEKFWMKDGSLIESREFVESLTQDFDFAYLSDENEKITYGKPLMVVLMKKPVSVTKAEKQKKKYSLAGGRIPILTALLKKLHLDYDWLQTFIEQGIFVGLALYLAGSVGLGGFGILLSFAMFFGAHVLPTKHAPPANKWHAGIVALLNVAILMLGLSFVPAMAITIPMHLLANKAFDKFAEPKKATLFYHLANRYNQLRIGDCVEIIKHDFKLGDSDESMITKLMEDFSKLDIDIEDFDEDHGNKLRIWKTNDKDIEFNLYHVKDFMYSKIDKTKPLVLIKQKGGLGTWLAEILKKISGLAPASKVFLAAFTIFIYRLMVGGLVLDNAALASILEGATGLIAIGVINAGEKSTEDLNHFNLSEKHFEEYWNKTEVTFNAKMKEYFNLEPKAAKRIIENTFVKNKRFIVVPFANNRGFSLYGLDLCLDVKNQQKKIFLLNVGTDVTAPYRDKMILSLKNIPVNTFSTNIMRSIVSSEKAPVSREISTLISRYLQGKDKQVYISSNNIYFVTYVEGKACVVRQRKWSGKGESHLIQGKDSIKTTLKMLKRSSSNVWEVKLNPLPSYTFKLIQHKKGQDKSKIVNMPTFQQACRLTPWQKYIKAIKAEAKKGSNPGFKVNFPEWDFIVDIVKLAKKRISRLMPLSRLAFRYFKGGIANRIKILRIGRYSKTLNIDSPTFTPGHIPPVKYLSLLKKDLVKLSTVIRVKTKDDSIAQTDIEAILKTLETRMLLAKIYTWAIPGLSALALVSFSASLYVFFIALSAYLAIKMCNFGLKLYDSIFNGQPMSKFKKSLSINKIPFIARFSAIVTIIPAIAVYGMTELNPVQVNAIAVAAIFFGIMSLMLKAIRVLLYTPLRSITGIPEKVLIGIGIISGIAHISGVMHVGIAMVAVGAIGLFFLKLKQTKVLSARLTTFINSILIAAGGYITAFGIPLFIRKMFVSAMPSETHTQTLALLTPMMLFCSTQVKIVKEKVKQVIEKVKNIKKLKEKIEEFGRIGMLMVVLSGAFYSLSNFIGNNFGDNIVASLVKNISMLGAAGAVGMWRNLQWEIKILEKETTFNWGRFWRNLGLWSLFAMLFGTIWHDNVLELLSKGLIGQVALDQLLLAPFFNAPLTYILGKKFVEKNSWKDSWENLKKYWIPFYILFTSYWVSIVTVARALGPKYAFAVCATFSIPWAFILARIYYEYKPVLLDKISERIDKVKQKLGIDTLSLKVQALTQRSRIIGRCL